MTKQEIAAVLYVFVPAYVANMSPVFVRKWFAPGKSWIGFDQLDFFIAVCGSRSTVIK
ncbi:MAG: hypothetical protein ACHQ9S_26090 [Candidatus Binatia bacterium]